MLPLVRSFTPGTDWDGSPLLGRQFREHSVVASKHYARTVSEMIKQSELRNSNAEIMRRVAHGESFTVTVHGQPVADLVPHQRLEHRRRRLVPAAEFDEAIAQLPPVDVARWKRDRAEADVIFGEDQPTDPWEEARTTR